MAESILSFPDRGHWGSASWRGNASGHVYRELFERLKPSVFVDPMVGSGTSVEVAREMGIEAHGLDLHSGFNALRDSIRETVGKEADLVASHPPYHTMIKYSGAQWGDAPVDGDLSHCGSVDEFNEAMELVLLNQREATRASGHYACLIGDMRSKGRYYSFQAELIARMPRNELAAVVIKQQHNHQSSFRSYGRLRLPRIEHEYLLIWRKPDRVMSMLETLDDMARAHHNRLRSSWRSVVRSALVALGGEADLSSIYDWVSANAPANLKSNANWTAKIRQIVQRGTEFTNTSRGVWALAA